jgi:hypothetical protein
LAVEGTGRWRLARLVAAGGVLVAFLGVGAWLLFGSGDSGEDGPPDLDGALVDGRALESCLNAAPSPGTDWRVKARPSRQAASGVAPVGAEIEVRTYGDLTVYPTEAAAEELDSRVSFDGERYAGERPHAEHWGNVLMTGYDEGEPTAAAEDIVKGCVEQAATVTSQPTEGKFRDCGGDPHLEALSVRGISCGEAIQLLRDPPRTSRCREDGGRFVCLSEYLCCMLSAQYMGKGEVEVVFNY